MMPDGWIDISLSNLQEITIIHKDYFDCWKSIKAPNEVYITIPYNCEKEVLKAENPYDFIECEEYTPKYLTGELNFLNLICCLFAAVNGRFFSYRLKKWTI